MITLREKSQNYKIKSPNSNKKFRILTDVKKIWILIFLFRIVTLILEFRISKKNVEILNLISKFQHFFLKFDFLFGILILIPKIEIIFGKPGLKLEFQN